MYNQAEVEKKERRKIIAVAVAIVAVILALLVAIIVVATKKSRNNGLSENAGSSFIISEDEETTEEEKPEETSVGVVTNEIVTSTPVSNEILDTSAAMPSTGPEDFLPIALMAGMMVAYLSSVALAKREA